MNEGIPEELSSPVLAIGQKNGMELFADVVAELSSTTKTNDKLDALVNYFAVAPGKDKVWLIALFSGRRPRRVVNSTQLWNWCIEVAGIPAWLFAESYHTVGDLAETIALLLPDPSLLRAETVPSNDIAIVAAETPLPPETAFLPHQSTLQQSLSYYLEKFIKI
ncbi:MAG TPA: hypothetical protein VEZ17_17540, partial [Chitinophagaceae bacterium]|nr:hypothetical protein [Chitinophagaceae bacterium]